MLDIRSISLVIGNETSLIVVKYIWSSLREILALK